MFRITRFMYGIIVIVFIFALTTRVQASVPTQITYQGFLTNSSGTPLTGTYSIKFSIYDEPTGGSLFWSETHSVTVTNGTFQIILGDSLPLYPSFFVDSFENKFLGIKVGTDPELTPRTKFTSVPYALNTGTIDGAEGGTITGPVSIQYGKFAVNYYGDYGSAISAYCDAGALHYGVYGVATDANAFPDANCAGVYGGAAGGGGTVWAGYFDGWVNVTGSLFAGAKFFKIDDPQDPADRTLTHSCVESNEYKNIYDGTVILDSKGTATVTLPEWFDDLNKDFRYQLTCIGGYAPMYIDKEVTNNQFTIAGGKAGLKISWQITGVRKDAYAQAHQFSVINEKKGMQRGKYLHPKENGVNETLGIDYAEQKIMEESRAKQNAENAGDLQK